MLSENLFNEVLINPALNDSNELFIVSGYASSAMAFHHYQTLLKESKEIKIHLIVGMTVYDGISTSNHRGFQKLVEEDLKDRFECSYLMNLPPVHSKVYSWLIDGKPAEGFIGSANYSQRAFGQMQREAMDNFDAKAGLEYYQSLVGETVYCNHPDAEDLINIFSKKYEPKPKREEKIGEFLEPLPEIDGLEYVTVDFLDRSNDLPQRSGLNWGQRPEEHREPNQAYIPLPSSVYNSDFFPKRGQHFTILTDDNKVLICTRAQDNGKAIHTPHNNSLLGEYFRNRLGLANGALVSKEDLLKFGRTSIDFYKIDEETYYLDFSKKNA